MTKLEYKKLKNAKIRLYLKAIESIGFKLVRYDSTSHMIYKCPGYPVLSIPNHDTISPGIWRSIGKLINLV